MMKNVRTVSEEVATKVTEINYLCMSPGLFTLKGKDDTEEGIDRKMALHFYSRYFICTRNSQVARFLMGNLFLPMLQAAVDKGEDGRLLTVLAAGKGGPINMDDLGLKQSSSLKRKADCAATYNDLMVEVFPTFLLPADLFIGTSASKPQSLIHPCVSWLG